MTPLNLDMRPMLPEIILAAVAVLVVFIDMFQKELKTGARLVPIVCVLGLVAAGVASVPHIDMREDFARMVTIDNFTAFFRFTFIGVAIVLIIGSHEYIERHVNHVDARHRFQQLHRQVAGGAHARRGIT